MLIFSPWAAGKVIINIDIAKFSYYNSKVAKEAYGYNVSPQEK